jgi:hypothetical protein
MSILSLNGFRDCVARSQFSVAPIFFSKQQPNTSDETGPKWKGSRGSGRPLHKKKSIQRALALIPSTHGQIQARQTFCRTQRHLSKPAFTDASENTFGPVQLADMKIQVTLVVQDDWFKRACHSNQRRSVQEVFLGTGHIALKRRDTERIDEAELFKPGVWVR